MENCLCRPGDGKHYVYDPKCPVHPPEDLHSEIDDLKRQLTEKDILLDKYIGLLTQIKLLINEKVN
jgi:hypothetical protein